MSALEVQQTLSADEARSLTDEVKFDAERLWRKLVELHEGCAHLALGYSSWGSYCSAEFDMAQAQAYRMLHAGQVAAVIQMDNRQLAPPATEAQARELAPLLAEPDKLREAWIEASADGEPTAAKTREAVQRRVLTVPQSEEALEKQQRQTLISSLDLAVYSLEGPPSTAAAEAARLLAGGDAGPFTPSRFERVQAYAAAFAVALREAGVDG